MAELKADAMRARRYRMPRTVAALVLREMATTYGRSPGGYLWAILEPVAVLALMSLIFSFAFRSPSLGTNFPLFYATGYLPFVLFNDVANKMATSIRFSKQLLAYPSVTFVDALLARFTLSLLTHLMVGYIVLSGILLVFDTRAILDLGQIFLAYAMGALLGLGVGTLNCFLMTSYPAWERAWQIVTRPLFLISCIFFVFDDMPPIAQDILWFNPLVHLVGTMRRGFYATYHGDYISLLYVAAVSVICLMLGLVLLWRDHRNLING